MAKKSEIVFEACLQQSTPGARPIKFSAEGDSVITLEADASQQEEIKKLVGKYGIVFRVTLEVVG